MYGSESSYGTFAGGHGLQDLDAHHRPDVGVLDEDDVALNGFEFVVAWCAPLLGR